MTEQLGLRIEPELLAEIDAWSETIRPKPKRSAAARELIIEGLKSFRPKPNTESAREGE
jgi:metal-responsive CopG/Arc/MetJ family transcriptional regulator